MTEQEADVFASRLTRIWEPISSFDMDWSKEEGIQFECLIADEVGLWGFISHGNQFSDHIALVRKSCQLLHLHSQISNVWIGHEGWSGVPPEDYQEQLDKFAAEWMGVFRGNCWLSGYDFECTAHEKTEWMRGFSREEIEAWDLKI